jgi:RimJ/RimL family protein N-acetyltransferase
MEHALSLAGRRFALRPATSADSRFIVDLRTDPVLARYLHPTSPRLEDQFAWMQAYAARPGDFYFVIEDRKLGEPVGTVGLYDLAGAAAEWGRWLIRPGCLAAVESALLVYRLAFERLELEEAYCRTIAENAQVVSFHDSMGARRRRRIDGYAVLADGRHDAVEHVVSRAEWPALRPRLERLADRVAGA